MTDDQVRQAWRLNTERLSAIIRPVAQRIYSTDVEWRDLDERLAHYGRDWGGMDLNPDFQRGHVWTEIQQQRFIEAALRGTLGTSALSIQFNCPNWENEHYCGDLPRGFQCIDGLQRITAVSRFIQGHVLPFGLSVADLDLSKFQIKNNYAFRLEVFAFEQKAKVIEHYLGLKDGGTPHSEEEIARVRNLLAESTVDLQTENHPTPQAG